MIRVTLVLEPQPEGGYTVTCPYLPEPVTEGDTQDEALANACDAPTAVHELHAGAGRRR
ncbi:type II toxin-antitoxin system HicB family antitoxin [Candidatus Palauibacter sp.]|uniref:type II toxin-antitoxin system HicB family antitoxin n=1 Tax=Candidatus Palauibacter sp. TaxID=3101350 RepID=UPI003B02A3C7